MYTLLPSKSRDDYTLLREEMLNLGLCLEPECVTADFDISLVQSESRASVSLNINQRILLPLFSMFMEKSPLQALGLVAWSGAKIDAPQQQENDDYISYFEST